MNQQLEHGMMVRPKHNIYSVETGRLLWSAGVNYKVVSRCGLLVTGSSGYVIWRAIGYDYSSCFEIIPDPMTAEEAMEKIMACLEEMTYGHPTLRDVIDEYKKGRE